MAEFAKLPLWTDALLSDTGHLSNEEFGIYMRLLIMIWRNSGCKIPANTNWLMRRLGVKENEYNDLYKPIIDEFLQSDGNYLTQKRLMKEFLFLKDVSSKNSVSAKLRWNKEKTKSDGNATKPNEPITEDKSSAPVDFKRVIFDEGLRWLATAGKRTPTSMRSLLGKWCKDYGDSNVAAVLVKAQQFSPVEPISFVERMLKDAKTGKPTGSISKPNKTERLYASVQRAAESGGFASGSGGEAEAGNNVSPELPGFENIR